MEREDVKISLTDETLDELGGAHHGTLATPVPRRAGFALECFTMPERRYLLEQPSSDAIRPGFDRAANG